MTGSTLVRAIVLNRILRFLFIVFAVFGVVSVVHAQGGRPANTSLCNLERATAADVQRLVDQGTDANGMCNQVRSRPLHMALLPGAQVPSAVIQALITAGGDVLVENINGDTPASLSESRFEEAVSAFQAGEITLAEFNDRQAVYNVINRALEALSAAYQNLCSIAWWRSASDSSMVSLLDSAPGLDPDRACPGNNDTPLRRILETIDPVTSETSNAIATFIGNASPDLQAINDSLERRYDRLRVRVGAAFDRLCQNITREALDSYNALAATINSIEAGLYIGVRERMGESDAEARLNSDFFGHPQGTAAGVQQVCEYRRNNR